MEFQLLMIREIPWNSRQGKLEIHGIPDCILLTCSEAKVVKKEEDMIKCVLLLEKLLRQAGREVDEEEPEQQEAPDEEV